MRTVRVAVVGCGSASGKYLRHLGQSPYVNLVAVCDQNHDRARRHAETYAIEHAYQDLGRMLAELDFELLVNLTPMPLHATVSRQALEGGRNVWSEKPIATELAEAQALLALARRQGVGLWGSPANPISPAFQSMANMLASGAIGRVHAAHGIAGSSGPDWPGSAWFYRKGGGSLFDLGVYNVTLLTGLLGPTQGVAAMSGTAIPRRPIGGESITVEADDNTALILDHGDAVYSVIQTGFVYGAQRDEWTMQLIGTDGAMTMGGYPWEPQGVSVHRGERANASGHWERLGRDEGETYVWQSGATYIAECLAREVQPILSGEHAVHTLDVMQAALHAAQSGHNVRICSTFPWPPPKRGNEQGMKLA